MRKIILAEGTEFSQVIAGFMRVSDAGMTPEAVLRFVEQCLDLGVTSFDHADIYGNYSCETIFGQAVLAKKPGLRQQMQIITKTGIVLPGREGNSSLYYDTSMQHILKQVDHSLSNLQTDYIDLLLIHRPDPLADHQSIARAFETLTKAGKVRHFGVSNFSPLEFDALQKNLPFKLVTNQVEFSVSAPQVLFDGTVSHAQMHSMPLIAWSPLAGGRIFHDTDTTAIRLRVKLSEIAKRYQLDSIDKVMYAWLLMHPVGVGVITGTMNIDRIAAAVDMTDFSLTRQEWFEILEASRGYSVP